MLTFLRYNSMFALIALGMCFVIMTGGIDLSVGATAAMASVVAALLSPYHWAAGLAGGMAAGLAVGLVNGADHHPAAHPAVHRHPGDHAGRQRHGAAARRQPVGLGLLRHRLHRDRPGRFPRLPDPGLDRAVAYIVGWVALELHPFGRHVLAVGGGEARRG